MNGVGSPPGEPPVAPEVRPGEAPGTPPAVEGSEGAGAPTPPEFAGLAALRHRIAATLGTDDRARRLAISLLLALAFVAGVLAYTRGALLYAIDDIGIYSWHDIFLRPRPDYLFPALLSAILPGQFYVVFYLNLFAELALVSYAVQSFARVLAARTFSPSDRAMMAAFAAVLYLLSPVSVTYRYASLLLAVAPSVAAMFLVMRYLVEAARGVREGTTFPTRHAVWLGLAAGFSMPDSLPDDARVATLEVAALVVLLVFALWEARRAGRRPGDALRSVRPVLTIALPVGALLFLYPVYLFATNGSGLTLAGVETVALQYTPHFTSGAYNTLAQTLRLLGRRTFAQVSYNGMYQQNPGVVLGSLLWPILALFFPIATSIRGRYPDRYLVLPLALLALLGTFWEAGTNPPCGIAYSGLAGLLPYGPVYFQTYSLTTILLAKLFPVLIAFSAVAVARYAARWLTHSPAGDDAVPGSRGRAVHALGGPARARTMARLGVGIAVVFVATLAAWPIYSGAVESDWGSPAQKGFFVPAEYGQVRNLLGARAGDAAFLPQVGAYVRTSWGYNGASGFYGAYFAPHRILVPLVYGPYGLSNPTISRDYALATNPLVPGTNGTVLPSLNYSRTTTNASPAGERNLFQTARIVNLTGEEWVTVSIPVSDPATIQSRINAGDLWVGIGDTVAYGATIAWYAIGSNASAEEGSLNASALTVGLLLPVPSQGNTTLSEVDSVILWDRETLAGPSIFNGTPTWSVTASSGVRAGWFTQLDDYGMHYLLVDDSLQLGALQSYSLVNSIVAELLAAGDAHEIFQGQQLGLYALTPPASS